MNRRHSHRCQLRAVVSAAGLAAALSMTVPTFAQEPPAAPESDAPALPPPETRPDAQTVAVASTPSTTPMQATPAGPTPASSASAEPRATGASDSKAPERTARDEPAATATADKKNRHTGFHMRGELGLASMGASATAQGATLQIGGLSTIASLLVGGAVTENLIIAGELWTMHAIGPDFTMNGATVGTSNDISASLSGIGANVTYYLMPANVFFSVTPSVGVLSVEDQRDLSRARTKTGFSARMAIGKEWWVASHLGIGVAANGYLGFNGDELTTSAARSTFYWTTLGAGASFTGSYN